MIFPSSDSIEKNVGSRYSLVVLAAKRAKQIKEGAPVLIDTDSTNPLTIAMEEIAAGKVTILAGSDAMVPQAPRGAEDTSPTAGLVQSNLSEHDLAGTDDADEDHEDDAPLEDAA